MLLALGNVWLAKLRRWGGRIMRFGRIDNRPEGAVGVAQLGHRQYVGGRWDEIGRLQFEFLVAHGLLPRHVLLDVACGSLRAGVHLIPYLDRSHYWGLDKESDLIDAGLKKELDPEIRGAKEPQFLINSDFEVSPIRPPADYIWIHSLFTHLSPEVIQHCLRRISNCATAQTICYATFFETRNPTSNPREPHDHEQFFYTREQMREYCLAAGWTMEYVGEWKHPRGQMMLRLRPNG